MKSIHRLTLSVWLCMATITLPLASLAGSVSGLHVFANGEPADADDVNENFNIIATEVNDNDTRFTMTLSLANTALTTATAAANSASTAQNRVAGSCSAGSSIRAIQADGSVTCEPDTDTNTQLTNDQVATAALAEGFVKGPRTVDTTLDEAAVDAFVANNGYAMASSQGPHDRPGTGVTALGEGALNDNLAIGDFNTATGYESLRNNTEGEHNTAHGASSLYANTMGMENTAVGNLALYSNTLGGQNTASGHLALLNNSEGNENTAVGTHALLSNISGERNTALGANAMYDNAAGSYNTAVGYEALKNTDGDNNIALGFLAGSHTTGDHNILIGHRGNAGENAIVRIGNADDHIETHLVGSLHLNDDSNNYDVWIQGGESTSPGTDRNLALLGQAYSDTLVINYGNEYSNGAEVQSNLNVTGCINGSFCSDARLKVDMKPLNEPVLGEVMKIEATTYQWKENPDQGTRIGLIAQQVETVFPEVVSNGTDGGKKGLSCTGLNAITIQAIQELKEEKDGEIAALKAEQQRQLAGMRLEMEERLARLEHSGSIQLAAHQARMEKPE